MYVSVRLRHLMLWSLLTLVLVLCVPVVFGILLALVGVNNYEVLGFSFSDVDDGIFGKISIVGGTIVGDVTGDYAHIGQYDADVIITCGWLVPVAEIASGIAEVIYAEQGTGSGRARTMIHAGETSGLKLRIKAAGVWGILITALLSFGVWRLRPVRVAAIQCCSRCGYDLTASAGSRCPECGQ